MRLTEDQIEIIRTLLYRQFGAASTIWLFGSRTDDAAKGGDIDLYLEPARLPRSNLFLLRQELRRELEKRLHSAVDLVINTGHATAFMRLAGGRESPLNDRLAVLHDALAALEQAAQRLRGTHNGLAELFPLTPDGLQVLDESQRERLDAYAIRYARCQDLLFPAMRALGRAQLEPKAERSFLDLFALMQKQAVVGPIDNWERQRDLRNAVSHEYPNPTEIVDILNGIRAAVPEILGYMAALRQRAAVLG